MLKKKFILLAGILSIALFCSCNSSEKRMKGIYSSEAEKNKPKENAESTGEKPDTGVQSVKGYGLPVSADERTEAEADCKRIMNLFADIYEDMSKEETANDIFPNELLYEAAERIKDAGNIVRADIVYSNMENYKEFENFLNSCSQGKSGTAIIYEVYSNGGIGRRKYIYDGNDMYVVAANLARIGDTPVVTYISYTRIKEWRYTEKGWFCYELCVPEYPEVTEMMDGSCMVRVKPITEENREMSEKCVLGLGYQGNNILCSNWNEDCMENLDYNGLYEYLYRMKYQERFRPEDVPTGIPKEEFEKLMMEYLPITEEELERYAVFDTKNQVYVWERLNCSNYAPAFFGTSVPEVTHIKENDDGTITLTVNAVCRMVLCDDAVITHELTVRFSENGNFQYLGNEILNDGIKRIPDYQYRCFR